MQCSHKDKSVRPNTARSTKTNPAPSQICPSKLSRRELEDLYFSLIQNNLELKRVVNAQSEKIKVLATKLQRMTNTQRIYLGSETKECCGATKALVQNQKNIIQDLKQSKEVLREQVKQLNMKLCSTKQFLKRPVTVMALTSTDKHRSAKHRSASALNSRSTTDDLKKEFSSVSCQCFVSNRSTSALDLRSTTEKSKKDSTSVSCQCPESPVKYATTVSTGSDTRELPLVPYDENKCRTLMSEFKQEIASLQEALKTKKDDSDRVNRLEKEIVELRTENSHMKFVEAQQGQHMTRIFNDNRDIRQKLSKAENRCLDLETSLKIERSKVAELEAKIRANDICNKTYDKIAESQIGKDVNKSRRETPKTSTDYTRGKTQLKADQTSHAITLNQEMKKTVSIPTTCHVHCCVPQNEPHYPTNPRKRVKKTSEGLEHNRENHQSALTKKVTGKKAKINVPDLFPLKDNKNKSLVDPIQYSEEENINNELKLRTKNDVPETSMHKEGKSGPETEINTHLGDSPPNLKLNAQLKPEVISPKEVVTDEPTTVPEQIPETLNKFHVHGSKDTKFSSNEMKNLMPHTTKNIPGQKESIQNTIDTKKEMLNYKPKCINKRDVSEKADELGATTETNMDYSQDGLLSTLEPMIIETQKVIISNPESSLQNFKSNANSKLDHLEPEQISIAEPKKIDVNYSNGTKSNEFANTKRHECTPHEDLILNNVEKSNFPSPELLSRTEASTPQKLDDSGFADVNKSVDFNNEVKGVMDKNNQLLEKITNMQAQLNNLVKTLMSPNKQKYEFVPIDSKDRQAVNYDQLLNEPQRDSTVLPMTDDQRSLARIKYTAAKHSQEVESSETTSRIPRYVDKTSTPVTSKSKIIRDSITHQPQFIPNQESLFDDEDYIDSDLQVSKTLATPMSNSKSAVTQNAKLHDSFEVDKRVSLKLEPELYDNLSNNKAQTETAPKLKQNINGDIKYLNPGPLTGIHNKFRDSINNDELYEDREDDGPPNKGKRHIIETNMIPGEYTEERTLHNNQYEKNFLLEKGLAHPGTQSAPDSMGQAPESGGEVPNTGQYSDHHDALSWKTTDKSQSARNTPSLKSTLASLKEKLCSKGIKTYKKRCLLGLKDQGVIPEDCSCRSTDRTGRCSCADVDFGPEGVPEDSASHQKARVYDKAPRSKILAPLALTDNSQANGTNSPKTIGDPFSPDKTNIDEFDFAEKEHLNKDETKSLNEAWPPGKINDKTESLHSELSGIPSHIQLRSPIKPKALIIKPLTPVAPTDQQKLEQQNAVDDKQTFVEPLNICEEYVHICNCPKSTRREVEVFRSCSGTLRFQTVSSAKTTFRRCVCCNKNSSHTGVRDFEKIQTASEVSPELNKTFTIIEATNVKPVAQISRSASPENTDQEISHMTDLPSEKNTPASTPRDRFRQKSPGEHRTTSTDTKNGSDYTSSSAPISNVEPISLSEGEIPQSDIGLQEHKARAVQTALPESMTKQVEQSLQTIAEDLVRCRQLLYATKALQVEVPKPTEVKENQDSQFSSSNDSKISLHAVSGRSHLQQSPRVMFIMHIGTMVLSDEAVLNYRDLKLVLKWKFYDQNVSMSRVMPGRVVHFDFSTQYDQKLTDDFLNYLKTEELIINVCDVNNLEAPLASCSLPLREALLHTNKRVDMSLALVADPSAERHPVADSIDKGDEMGVLDLWCMLRADVSVLPEINKAITVKHKQTNSNNSFKRRSFSGPILDQIVLDDQDEMQEDELSSVAPVQKITPRDYSHEEFDSSVPISFQKERLRDAKKFPVYPSLQRSASPIDTRTKHSIAFGRKDFQIHGSATSLGDNYTNNRDWMAGKEPTATTDEGGRTISDTPKTARHLSHLKPSGILINDVKPNIRNPSDMKRALENRFIANKKPRKTSPKSETENKTRNSLQDMVTGVYEKKVVLPSPMGKVPSLEREHRGGPRESVNESKHEDSTKSIISEYPLVPMHNDRYYRKSESISQLLGLKRNPKSNNEETSNYLNTYDNVQGQSRPPEYLENLRTQTIDITILWLALNEECQAMQDPNVQRLYVAYSFLGHGGAELETPQSLPKPKQYHEKCYFNFKKRFHLTDPDFVALGHMAHVRSNSRRKPSRMDCVIFDVVSEPVEDPLGLNNCEDIGTAHLYFGDLIAYGAGSNTYTDVLPVQDVVPSDGICGVLAVRVDGLDLVRASARMMEAGVRRVGVPRGGAGFAAYSSTAQRATSASQDAR